MDEARKILVGVVGAAQGVRGEVRIKSYTGDPAALGSYGPLETDGGRAVLKVLALRPLKNDMVVARLEGIDDRDAAGALTNTRLYVDRSRLPPPGEEEFYQVDLIGLGATTAGGEDIGRVVAVQNFGAGDLLEIAPDAGPTLLVPFTKAFVPVVDFEARRVVIAPGALAGAPGDEAEHGDEAAS